MGCASSKLILNVPSKKLSSSVEVVHKKPLPFDVIIHIVRILLQNVRKDPHTLINFILASKVYYNAFLKIVKSTWLVWPKSGYYWVTLRDGMEFKINAEHRGLVTHFYKQTPGFVYEPVFEVKEKRRGLLARVFKRSSKIEYDCIIPRIWKETLLENEKLERLVINSRHDISFLMDQLIPAKMDQLKNFSYWCAKNSDDFARIGVIKAKQVFLDGLPVSTSIFFNSIVPVIRDHVRYLTVNLFLRPPKNDYEAVLKKALKMLPLLENLQTIFVEPSIKYKTAFTKEEMGESGVPNMDTVISKSTFLKSLNRIKQFGEKCTKFRTPIKSGFCITFRGFPTEIQEALKKRFQCSRIKKFGKIYWKVDLTANTFLTLNFL